MLHEMCWRPTPPAWEEAGRELAAHFATDVLIIEDEALIALDPEVLVEILGHRVGIARTRGKAVAIARTKSSGLLLFLQSSISSGAGGQR
jgi:hypothetical protein